MNKKNYKNLSKLLLATIAVSATAIPGAANADNLTNYPGTPAKILKYEHLITDFTDELPEDGLFYTVDNENRTITYDFPKNKITQLAKGYGFSTPESIHHGEYKVVINAKDIMVNNDGGFKMPEGVDVVINGDMHINGHSQESRSVFPSGVGFAVGEGTGARTRVIVNGTLDTTKFGTDNGYGLVDDFDRGALGDNPGYKGARWLPNGIFGRPSHGSEIFVNNVDIRVRGIGVTSDPYYISKDVDDYDLMTVNINKGKIITPSIKDKDFDNLSYYSLANFGGTININAYSNRETSLLLQNNDVNMVGNIITIRDVNYVKPGSPAGAEMNPFFYRNGRTNINLNTPSSTWDGTIDNSGTEMAGEINLFLQNGAKWNNENMSVLDGLDSDNMPTPSRYKYGHYDGKAYLNTLVGGKTQEETGFITMNDKAPLIINKVSGYSKFIYQHNNQGDKAGDYTAGDVIVKAADENAHITLATPNNNIDTNNKDLVGKVLNTLAGKSTYANAGKDTNLAGKVEISEGLTSSSASADLTKDIIFDATNGGKGKVDLPKTPEVQPPKEETKPDVQPPVVEPTPGGDLQPEPPQPEPPQPAPEPEPEPEPSTPEVPAGEVLNLPPLNAANPDAAWVKYKSDDSYSVNEHPVNITANNDNTVVKETVTAIAANVSDGELYVGDGDLNIVATSTDNTLVTAINDETVNNFSITAPNVNIKASANAKRDRVEGIHVKDATSKEDITSLDLSAVDNVTKIKVEARSKAYGVYTIGNTDVELSNVDMTGDSSDDWGVVVKSNTGDWGYYSAAGLYAGSNYALGNNKGGVIKVSNGLKIRSQGTGIMANGAGATVNVYNSTDNPINIEVSQEKGKMNYALLAQAGHIAINVNPSGQLVGGENAAPVTIKGNVFLANGSVNDNEPEKNTSIAVGLNNDQSSLTGLIIDNFRDDQLKTNSITAILQLQNGATWNNENYGYDGKISGVKSRLAELIGGKDKAKAGIINQNSDLDVTIDNYSGNTFVNYKHDGSDPTKILGGGITVKSAEANSFVGLRTDNGGIDTSDAQSPVVRNVLSNLAGKLTYQGAIGNKENNLSGTVAIAEGLTASAATVKVEDVIKFNETTGVGELNQVAPPPAPPEEEHPSVSPTPGEEQPPVQPPTGEQNPPVEPPTGETTPPATGGDSGSSTIPPTTGGESGSQEQPVPPTTGEGSGSHDQPVQPPAGEQPGTQPGGQPQQPPVVPSKPMAPPNINLGNYETAVMKSIRASQSVSVLALREMANDVTKRLGDLHFNQGDAGLWAKVESDKHNYDKRNVYGEYNGKAIHVGYDKKVNGNWLVGGQFTHLTGDTKYSDGKGDSSLNTIGLYGTKVNDNGSYVDIITKFGKLRNDYKVNTKEFNLAGKAKQNVQSFSVETGRRFTKDNGSFFEPQAELIYSHLPQAEYYLTDGEHTLAVKQGSLDSLVARLGLAVGRKTDTSSIQAKLSIHNELLGTTSTVFKGENTKTVKYDYSGTWFTLGLAGTKQVSNGANIYGEITKAFGGGYSKAWNINLGARWMF